MLKMNIDGFIFTRHDMTKILPFFHVGQPRQHGGQTGQPSKAGSAYRHVSCAGTITPFVPNHPFQLKVGSGASSSLPPHEMPFSLTANGVIHVK
jgi:hypothetical protein